MARLFNDVWNDVARLFNDVWNDVARRLPEGWDITVSVDGRCGGSDVVLTNDDGDEISFPSNQTNLEETVLDALAAAEKASA